MSRRLYMTYANTRRTTTTFGPKMEGTFVPAVRNGDEMIANPAYKGCPGALLRVGNLPRRARARRRSGHAHRGRRPGQRDGTGLGAFRFAGFIDNTEVFRNIVDALGLAPQQAGAGKKAAVKVRKAVAAQ